MNKTQRICQIALLIISLFCFTKHSYAQAISDHFFGENAWMPDTIGNSKACTDPPCVLNGKLHRQWDNVKSSNASLIRFGGIAPDKNMPTNYQYIRMIDSIRANGMEPIIQVPFHNNRYTAQQAANIVKYINKQQGKNVKYWIVGNEPDLGYSYTSASQVAAYLKSFASAMKTEDPSILIIGPECAWFNRNIIDGLTTPNGPDDITGKDGSGRYYLDIISFHTYPFNGSQNRDQVISKLTASDQLQDNLIYLNTRVTACNKAHNRTGNSVLKTAITEANINWQNNVNDNLNGVGANSFIGGQFIAEMMGIGMKHGLDFINIWSVVEGNTTVNNIGYIDPSTNAKKSTFHHFKILAENFKGNYANGVTNQSHVKSFGCKNSSNISVLIMNQDLSKNYNFTVRLNTSEVSMSNPLVINIDAGVDNEYSDVIPSQSTMLLTFNSNGMIVKKCSYSLLEHAMTNQDPSCTEFYITGEPSRDDKVFDMSALDFKVFPNPSNGKFTLEFNTTAFKQDITEKIDFEIQLINSIGQEVYRRSSEFLNGKEEIELTPDIAAGAYILRVKKGERDEYMVKKILLE